MIEIKNISKTYGTTEVLQDVSVTIEKGKITTFVGANGAGKSTLLNIVGRIIKQNSGEVLLEGQPISKIKDRDMAKKLAFLKQSNFVNVKITVRELVAFGRFPHSQGRLKKDDQEAIDQAISYMGLEDLQDKYIDQISGGQRQRAFIAMTVAQDTDYILLDEPLNNLDMKYSVQIMQTLQKLVEDTGKTIVLVIHDINFASCYSDVIVALKDGKIVKAGTVDEVVEADVLREVFDLDFKVQDINNCKLCFYYKMS